MSVAGDCSRPGAWGGSGLAVCPSCGGACAASWEPRLVTCLRVNNTNAVSCGTVFFISFMMTCYPILHKVNCV